MKFIDITTCEAAANPVLAQQCAMVGGVVNGFAVAMIGLVIIAVIALKA